MEICIGNSVELINKAKAIRYQVFTEEQNIPQVMDLDGLDEESNHVLVTDNGALVATARLLVNDDNASIMARVAVIKEYRGLGIASKVIHAVLTYAGEIGVRSIKIHAHEYLQRYYEKFGFEFIRPVEVVCDHQLIEMQYQVAHT